MLAVVLCGPLTLSVDATPSRGEICLTNELPLARRHNRGAVAASPIEDTDTHAVRRIDTHTRRERGEAGIFCNIDGMTSRR